MGSDHGAQNQEQNPRDSPTGAILCPLLVAASTHFHSWRRLGGTEWRWGLEEVQLALCVSEGPGTPWWGLGG